ncbi:SMI1/KNR4 family protein [Numidum massiliense]|uniref:SMI1/KNR4 family protein n=1 Tax=Numidum massiliense TaxID=1522315 RepID=UPI0006D52EE0|nr:SMI1/KNR4 family protein [Numidum massiliense]
MSSETYQKAKQIILSDKERSDFFGPRSRDLISKAEEVLGLMFSGSYLDFLLTFGAGNFGSEEIYGIINGDFENSSVPDAIWFTLTERREINLPNNLLVIYDTGWGELYCLDFNSADKGEPSVISYVPGIDQNQQINEVIANDFGDFLLELIEDKLSV